MRVNEKEQIRVSVVWEAVFLESEEKIWADIKTCSLLWGRVPGKLFMSVAILYGVFWIDRKKSPIDEILRSLVTVRVSQINWCRFCVDINSATLAKRSGSMEK